MFCRNCGMELKEGAVFCGGCGTLFGIEESAAVEKESTAEIIKEIEAEIQMENMAASTPEKFCPKCGKSLPHNALFCGGCGYSYSGIPTPKSTPNVAYKPENPKKKGKGGIIAIIIVLILALLGGGGYYAYEKGHLDFIFAGGKDKDEKKEKDSKKDKGKETDDEEVEYCSYCGEEKIELNGEMLCPDCDIIIEREEHEYIDEEETVADQMDYLFPSDQKLITADDLYGMSKEEVALIRNEIYARHGYIFQSEVYQEYFGKKDWYQPDPNFTADSLNAIETANKDFLVQYESDMGWR